MRRKDSPRKAAKKRVIYLLAKIEQLKKKAGAERRQTYSVPLEKLLNRCLNHITALKSVKALPQEDIHYALEYAWGVYMDLQNYDAPERQDYRADREISLNEVLERIRNSSTVPLESITTDMFSGGLGYRTVDWDWAYWMAVSRSSLLKDPFWNEKEAAKKKAVKHYTPEEIKKKFGEGL